MSSASDVYQRQQQHGRMHMLGDNSSFMAPTKGGPMYAGDFLSPPSGSGKLGGGDMPYCSPDLASMPCTLMDHHVMCSGAVASVLGGGQVLDYASCPTQLDASSGSRALVDAGPLSQQQQQYSHHLSGAASPVTAVSKHTSRQELLSAGGSSSSPDRRAGGKLGQWLTRLGSQGGPTSGELRGGAEGASGYASQHVGARSKSRSLSTRASHHSDELCEPGKPGPGSTQEQGSAARGISHSLRTLAQMFKG
jgi:hypothetical protein